MKTEGVTIGMDNGLDGGLCTLSNWDGSLIEYHAMPVIEVGGKREVCPFALSRMLRDAVAKDGQVTVCIEEPLKHAKTSQAMRSMAMSFGKVLGVCAAVNIPAVRIQVLDWQKVMLGKKIPKGKTKEFALQKAQQLWPDEQWLANKRCRTPHDGIVDAALIAHYHQISHEQTRHNRAA